MKDSEIVDEPSFEAAEIINQGEKISESFYRDIYRKNNEVVKVLKQGLRTDQMKRIGTYLPENLVPETVVRTEDLSDTGIYSGHHTVIYQDRFDERLDERLEASDQCELGDLIYLLDRIVDEDAVMTDPVVENFNYFKEDDEFLDGMLKPSDICDIESMKKLPDSFERENIQESYIEEVEKMYEEAIISVNYNTDLTMGEIGEIFGETSRYIHKVSFRSKLALDEWPEIEVFRQ
ncbi:MAG: hypothetical protein R6V35_00740 [Candidatus Nanohaloarchaea archaeon]